MTNERNTMIGGDVTATPTELTPGDMYYYNVTSFPGFDQLSSFLGNQGIPDIIMRGSLAGSEIFVKLIDKNTETMDHWDGSKIITDNLTTLDVSTGLIVNNQIDIVNTTVVPEKVLATFTPGMSIPVPTIFGTATYLNISNTPSMLEELPIALSDDYAIHETIISQASLDVNGSLSVTNDFSQFRVDFTKVGLDPSYSNWIDGQVTYSKPSGLLHEVNVVVTNSTSGNTLDFDFDLARIEHKELDLHVGDTYALKTSGAGMNFQVNSTNATITQNVTDQLGNIKSNMTAKVDTNIMKFTVVAIDGLYYSVEGFTYDENGTKTAFPAHDGYYDDHWFVGFGTNMMQVAEYPTQTYVLNSTGDPTNERMPLRQRAEVGPIVTEDYNIYDGYDDTVNMLFSAIYSNFWDALMSSAVTDPDVVPSSSTGGLPTSSLTVFNANGYDYAYGLNFNIDIRLSYNSTYIDADGISHDFNANFTYVADGSSLVGYNHGIIEDISIYGSLNYSEVYYGDITPDQITVNITDFHIDLTGNFTSNYIAPPDTNPTSPTTGPSSPTTTDNNSDNNNQRSSPDEATTPTTGDPVVNNTNTPELPGFSLLISFVSLVSLIFVAKYRSISHK